MKNFYFFILFTFVHFSLHANELLMNGFDATSLETEHNTAVDFWQKGEQQSGHKFFSASGSDHFSIRELNHRAISFWQKLGDCKGQVNGQVLALALLNLSIECPHLVSEVQELNKNYIEFLSSTEMKIEVMNLKDSQILGRVPLHPLLQQFSFNYYIHLTFAMKFEDGYLNDHDLYKILSLDIPALVLARQKRRAESAAAEAAWERERRNPPSLFSFNSIFQGSGAAHWAKDKLREIDEIQAATKRVQQYYDRMEENRNYLPVIERFVVNNLILTYQNLSHQFYPRSCTGIGIFEIAVLSGTFSNRLKDTTTNINVADNRFRSIYMSFCNSRIFNKTNIVSGMQKQFSHEDPTPEAIELLKFGRSLLGRLVPAPSDPRGKR